ncbi:helicase-related protein [Isoptericola sediminis]|uniref:Helicase n=1 Tax=Isoptericola sediminis TaxID=2733572 RepID=A0A849K7Y6_9MICO|nr:helicase-related protein [Isoptericola sediminis]NNU27307.1 helicase [Isoptericola sediminis]
MTETRPDVERTLASLKDFQRATVEHAFRRLFTDEDAIKRFLVADEVGLGKTMVAKGVIARAVDHLWDDPDRRLDVVYICSNSQIARQNLSRLNVVGGTELRHADRLTLLPHVIRDLRQSRLNFVSFTPGTSFQVSSTGGKAEERALLYQMLAKSRGGEFTRRNAWKKFFQGWMSLENFERRLAAVDRADLDDELCRSLEEEIAQATGPGGAPLTAELEACADEFAYRRRPAEGELARRRDRLVGTLRQLVARASVEHLEPDLVILDEFQRFKDLLDADADDEGAGLAHAVFDHPDAKVLLLSATPYKMYTLPDEPEGDDHYRDFTRTIRFLGGDERAAVVERGLRTLRAEVLTGGDPDRARAARDRVQHELRQVMCRTERLAATPDRDGMLCEKPLDVRLTPDDLRSWRTFDEVARQIDRHDVFEYWRSTPYPLNLMDRDSYQVRTRFQAAVERGDPDVAAALAQASGLLTWDDVRSYRAIDPGNAKMRGLVSDVLDRGAWRLAWVPPSLPYYAPAGAYADPALRSFTKRLVFSAWAVVPKAVAVMMSYGAERRAMEASSGDMPAAGRPRRRYDDRPVTPPLQFRMTSGDDPRPGAMSTLGLLHPSSVLARLGDPLDVARELDTLDADAQTVLDVVRGRLEPLLAALPPGGESGDVDRRWYWAAPMLLDQAGEHDDGAFWHLLADGGEDDRHDDGSAFQAHLRLAQQVSGLGLGRRPTDLATVLAQMAVAGPGVCALRALSRVTGGERALGHPVIRREAFFVAQGLRSLFNKPEIVAILRAEDDERYWRAVLDHCLDGVLQSVLDEYAHVLVESEGLQEAHRLDRAVTISDVMTEALTIRAATNVVEQVRVADGRVELDEHRMASHFAARYGRAATSDQTAVRESTVREAYNSPFRPFVLASTSVGQEGLDFHTYSHALVHWNLPSNPVDLEQREGRVHRYKGHAVRKNVAADHGGAVLGGLDGDPWSGVFAAASRACATDGSDITPYWVYARDGGAAIERYVPVLPLSREKQHYRRLQRTVGAYRMVIGQPRQDDLLQYVGESGADASWLRVDLTPEPVEVPAADGRAPAADRPVFDPVKDEPPVAPDPWGSGAAALWSQVLYDGGLLAINVREGRGATSAEHRDIACRAGYGDGRGVAGTRATRGADGDLWLTFVGRCELGESAYALGRKLPVDLGW